MSENDQVQMTVEELKAKFDSFADLLKTFDAENNDARAIRALKNEIFEAFKDTPFSTKEERQQLWDKFQEISGHFKDLQHKQNKENEEFAQVAEKQIAVLNEVLGEDFETRAFTKEELAEIKKKFNDTFEFIKQNRWPGKERRLTAWDTFNRYRDRFRKAEDEYYNGIREKIAKEKERSGALSAEILSMIEACHPGSAIESLIERSAKFLSFIKPLGYATTGFENLLKSSEAGADGETEKQKNPLRLKSEALTELRKFIGDSKDEITREDKQKIYSELDKVKPELDQAWLVYKEELQRKKDEREQKKADWEKKQREFLARLEDRLEKQIAFREKLRSISGSQQGFLEKLESRRDSQVDFIGKLHLQVDDLEDKLVHAWSDKFKEKVTEWIAEKKAKVIEVEKDIEQIGIKMAEVKTNIEELPGRMKELDNSIAEIEQKIIEVKEKL